MVRKPSRVRSQMTAFKRLQEAADYCSGDLGDISAQYLGMRGSGLFLALSLPYRARVCVLCMDESAGMSARARVFVCACTILK